MSNNWIKKNIFQDFNGTQAITDNSSGRSRSVGYSWSEGHPSSAGNGPRTVSLKAFKLFFPLLTSTAAVDAAANFTTTQRNMKSEFSDSRNISLRC